MNSCSQNYKHEHNWNQIVFKNKLDESGLITRERDRLVAKGYNKKERINYDEKTYAFVSRLEAVRLLLAFACMSGFKLLYKMF